MVDWHQFGQVAGGVLSYAILVKVFDFIKVMRENGKGRCHVGDGGMDGVHDKLDEALRILKAKPTRKRGD